jgi:hypothetical protein
MKRGFRVLLNALMSVTCLAVMDGAAHADIKVRTKSTQGGTTTENTTYIKGPRQRTEMAGGMLITVQQCDLKRDLHINPKTKTYMVNRYADSSETAERAPSQPQSQKSAPGNGVKGGVVTMTVTNKDTGERKQIFGYTARHIITTMVTESSPDACHQNKSKMEIDGWYIDFNFGLECDQKRQYQNYASSSNGGCQDRYEVKQIGVARTGFPVWQKTTMYDASGNQSFTMEQEAIEISKATLDAALFEVPADYREVKDAAEMYRSAGAAGDTTSGDNDAASGTNSGLAASVKDASSQTPSVSTSAGEKRPGVVRLALAAVKTGSVGEGMNATDLAAAIQNTLAQYLKSPAIEVVQIEVVQIEARLQSQIALEAKQKECDFVIYIQASHKKGGGGFGGMFSKSAPALGSVASMAGYGSHAGAVAGHVASTAIYTAAAMSANIKSKDELSLDVRLQSPDGAAPVVAKQLKAKAKSNGEDIISPLIEQAAQSILDAATRK